MNVPSKSLEYIKQRISEGNVIDMSQEEFKNMQAISFSEILNLTQEKQPIRMSEDKVYVTLTYNPNVDFDYFTLETCYSDGSLMFVYDLALKIIDKILNLKTCYSPAIEALCEPIDFDKYIIHYTVGEFIVNSYIVEESPDLDRPWLRNKFTLMLPIKFEIEER